jgi:2-succinyl-5-enolpyruvyl-6-hydroxy-3-cyclohexene-1-carboxylate synthase
MGVAVSVPTGGRGDADVQAAYAATLVDEWVRGGLEHAVVCPGSRSTPMVVALAAHPGVRVHMHLDERSAGFVGVGIGRATGRPAVVVTTSGTAAVELHPAVVEADRSGVPLLVCTADRPSEMHQVGASQTIDQGRLFGGSPRFFTDPGVADRSSRSTWRSQAGRVMAESRWGPSGPGPVHLNLPFREPLLGDPAGGGGVEPGDPDGGPAHQVAVVEPLLDSSALAAVADQHGLRAARRGVIVAGAGCGRPAAVAGLAAALGWPILAEPRSGLRGPGPAVVACADGILRSNRFAVAHRPEIVLRLGEQWLSKPVTTFLASAVGGGAEDIAVDPWGRWSDPDRTRTVTIPALPGAFCTGMTQLIEGAAPAGASRPEGWLSSWVDAEGAARAVVAAACGQSPESKRAPLSEPALAHRLFADLPADATLVVAASMPIRDVEAFALPRPDPPRVVANRGVNGIDGVVSSALGVALGSAGPTVALVGDLAFLHDSSALVRLRETDAALVVVVADNRGGGIFSFLDVASAVGERTLDDHFATPPESDVAAVARGFGWPVDDVDEAGGFDDALRGRIEAGGLAVVRVRVPDRATNVEVHRRINGDLVEAVDAALAAQQGRGS